MKALVIWEQQKRKCNLCREKDPALMSLDHIFPKAKALKEGWSPAQINARENLQVICITCHRAKDNKIKKKEAVSHPVTDFLKKWFFNEDKGYWGLRK